MSTGKCSLLKPVENLTGTFFMFSQYAQDLTKQYSAPDTWRCVPSKFIALNLDYSTIGGSDTETNAKYLGEIFQNYFENICTFYREKNNDFKSEDTLTFLFQTLEKYQFINTSEYSNTNKNGLKDITRSDNEIIGAISPGVQYIGDINIYSYDNQDNGVGYNEIYCYIPNDAKCMNYQLQNAETADYLSYDKKNICGYENQQSYNNLRWSVDNNGTGTYVDKDTNDNNFYGFGMYSIGSAKGINYKTLVPANLLENNSNDKTRTDDNGNILNKFDINTIIVLYDIISKDTTGTHYEAKNVPLGIYFTGALDEYGNMSNTITKYVDNEQIYNQGTSYGLRVCTRFLTNVNSTEIIETTTNGSTNISEIAPVLEKMGETLIETEKVLNDNDKTRTLLKEHLAQFKNNKVNVPYVRTLGNKKYWFVNGKNTGAIAQYEQNEQERSDILNKAAEYTQNYAYSKSYINDLFNNTNFVTREEFDDRTHNLQDFLTYLLDEKINELYKVLQIKQQE